MRVVLKNCSLQINKKKNSELTTGCTLLPVGEAMQIDSYVNGAGAVGLVSLANNSVKNKCAWDTLLDLLSKDPGKLAPLKSNDTGKICQN